MANMLYLVRQARQLGVQPCQVHTALQLRTTFPSEDHWSKVTIHINVTSLLQVISFMQNPESS